MISKEKQADTNIVIVVMIRNNGKVITKSGQWHQQSYHIKQDEKQYEPCICIDIIASITIHVDASQRTRGT